MNKPIRNLTLEISSREDWFLLAAIRMWQQVERGTFDLIDKTGKRYGVDSFEDIASCGWQDRALDAAEVDDLSCDVFGSDPWLNDDERSAVIAARKTEA